MTGPFRTRAVPLALALAPAFFFSTLPETAHADAAAGATCAGAVDPYKDYGCLDAYLGDDVPSRFINYYKLEMGQAAPPSDPNAPAGRIADWPATPQTTPPMPFTEWPYGGTSSLGVTRPGSVDSPFMAAISNTSFGQWMQNNHLQFYGWGNVGGNVSSNTTRPGGNAPMAYAYTPNTVQLDQLVAYLERLPDTVQTDHVDWGFRLSALYGVDYRYTVSYGLASDQLLKHNQVNGYDFPMVYGEMYIPQVAQGLMLRVGRYISIPDIEAQLAPNNYMYTHSMMYSFDNYTNEGLQATLALTKNLTVQAGINIGTESTFWQYGAQVHNRDPNPLFPGNTFAKDPGDRPSLAACIRYTWNDGDDTIYPCMDGINSGTWGYNNLQWYGFTYYHKFNDKWHLSFEAYDIHQNNVLNATNPAAQAAFAAGGTPFSPQFTPVNGPNLAQCHNPKEFSCRAEAWGAVAYLNYQITPLDNISFRPEFYDDAQGQRTGTKATYLNFGLGLQHWLSPQIEFRPEIDWDRSIDAKAFNGDAAAGIPGNKNYTVMVAADAIVHF
jgi:hypothetical protein